MSISIPTEEPHEALEVTSAHQYNAWNLEFVVEKGDLSIIYRETVFLDAEETIRQAVVEARKMARKQFFAALDAVTQD